MSSRGFPRDPQKPIYDDYETPTREPRHSSSAQFDLIPESAQVSRPLLHVFIESSRAEICVWKDGRFPVPQHVVRFVVVANRRSNLADLPALSGDLPSLFPSIEISPVQSSPPMIDG